MTPSTIAFRATYRVQLHKDFTFADATRIVGYLADLGFSHLYCSPIMKARPGSTHGYDIVDHDQLNPEIGTEAEFDTLVETLRRHEMGLLLDIVPNHMGVGPDNHWWLDVLEWGPASPFAEFFDIDWQSASRNLGGRVLLPILGDQFGTVLEQGGFVLGFEAEGGRFVITCNGFPLPVGPFSYGALLEAAAGTMSAASNGPLSELARAFLALDPAREDTAALRNEVAELKRRLAAIAVDAAAASAVDAVVARHRGVEGVRDGWETLGRLLDAQAYRPAYWRVAADEINYRRFFSINDLAGIRIERETLFDIVHRKFFDYIQRGKIDGLRIDHIDGLFDPKQYLERLQQRLGTPESPFYVLVEKILAHFETLPDAWPVAGTSGYDTINTIGALFSDPAAARPLETHYRRFSRRTASFDDILYASKLRILEANLASEVAVLAQQIHRLSSGRWRSRDFTLSVVRDALTEVIARFPVYRTYVDESGASPVDRRYIDWAVNVAEKRASQLDTSIYRFLHGILTGDLADDPDYERDRVLFLARRFQQLSGPAMAKGLEDTSFYRYFRLIALNEVGGDPRRFAVSPAAFHRSNEDRLKRRPDDMIGASTHDTKRGEDARFRLFCLTGMPREWAQRTNYWARLNRRLRVEIDGVAAPERNDEYYLYQTLLGVWPIELQPDDAAGLEALTERLEAALIKAVREGTENSSWGNPNEAYEQAYAGFARSILDPERSRAFLADFHRVASRVAYLGALTSLSATLLRLTMPGVPDTYRGGELWELSLVDPDNRRPVDYVAFGQRFDRLRSLLADDGEGLEACRELTRCWQDGRIKLALFWRTLRLRRDRPMLFSQGQYQPIAARGTLSEHVVAFSRHDGRNAAVTIVPRLWPSLLPDERSRVDWADTMLELPEGRYVDVFTQRAIETGGDGFPLETLLADFPVSLLVSA